MNPKNYVDVTEAAQILGVTRQWFYHLARKYGYRTQVMFGKTVYLRRDVEKTPTRQQRYSIAQKERWKKEQGQTDMI